MNNTVRKHPRSMAEAFPQEADTGDWEQFGRYRWRLTEVGHHAVFWFSLAGLIGMAIWGLA